MVKTIKIKSIKDFWSKEDNQNKVMFFVQKDANYPEDSDMPFLVGKQNYKYYLDSQYWDIIGNFFDEKSAEQSMKYYANKEKNSIIVDLN